MDTNTKMTLINGEFNLDTKATAHVWPFDSIHSISEAKQKLYRLNPNLQKLSRDVLYHLGMDTETHDLREMFGDIKFVCLGGTQTRMEKLAKFVAEELHLKIPPGMQLKDITGHTCRYSMFKVGPVLSVTVMNEAKTRSSALYSNSPIGNPPDSDSRELYFAFPRISIVWIAFIGQKGAHTVDGYLRRIFRGIKIRGIGVQPPSKKNDPSSPDLILLISSSSSLVIAHWLGHLSLSLRVFINMWTALFGSKLTLASLLSLPNMLCPHISRLLVQWVYQLSGIPWCGDLTPSTQHNAS